jgi:CheY-like chemotaxis protein
MTNTGPILVADDDADEIVLLRLAFMKAGLQNPLLAVADGEECVEYLRGDGSFADRLQYPMPQLLLLDLKMPRLNGIQVLTWLRAQPSLKQLPVIVLTGSTFDSDITRAYAAGANSFLPKLLDPAGLASQVKGIVDFWVGLCLLPTIAADPPPPPEPLPC